jgi:hypothetical protein
MRPRWIYLGLVLALTIAAIAYQAMGSREVSSHAYFHLLVAAVIGLLAWLVRPPLSTPNRWLWRGVWALSAAQWAEALGAFGYDDTATAAVPGLHFVHNQVAPVLLFGSILTMIGAALAVAWVRLPRVAAVFAVVGLTVLTFLLVTTMIGVGFWD